MPWASFKIAQQAFGIDIFVTFMLMLAGLIALVGGGDGPLGAGQPLARPQCVSADHPRGIGIRVTNSARLIFALFGDLVARGKTVVMVTHDRELARMIPRVEEVRDRRLVAA